MTFVINGASRAVDHSRIIECFMDWFDEAQSPPFTSESATRKVRATVDVWNSHDPARLVRLCAENTLWRNRTDYLRGKDELRAFLHRKWTNELNYRQVSEIWGTRENRMAVRFASEWHDGFGQWFRSHGHDWL